MPVQVVHLLATLGTRVGHNSETSLRIRFAALLKRQAGSQHHHTAQKCLMFRAHLGHGGDVDTRNDEKVHRRPRIDVVEGINLIVLIDLAAGNQARSNLAKNAVISGSAHVGVVGSVGKSVGGRSSLKRSHPLRQR